MMQTIESEQPGRKKGLPVQPEKSTLPGWRSNLKLLVIVFVATMISAAGVLAAEDRFEKWLTGVCQEAKGKGIQDELLDEVFRDLKPSERVRQLARKQPEFTMSFEDYQKLVIPGTRIEEGRALLSKHHVLLEEISRRYGVQPWYIVALWGVESDFGRRTGDFFTIEALATLAFEGRRAGYFRSELFQALRILMDKDILPASMLGSWAGAMGQCQFMPSSFRRYAVDYDRDGRRDIWNSLPDVFASIANYLARQGWHKDEYWGQQVYLPEKFNMKKMGKNRRFLVKDLIAMGVTPADKEHFPDPGTRASLIQVDSRGDKVFAVYHNWQKLMAWNNSKYFATSVGIMADQLSRQ